MSALQLPPSSVVLKTLPCRVLAYRVVDVAGSNALQTSVERRVYDGKGKLLYDDHWSSHYRGDYRLVRVGSKKRPPKKKVTTTTTTGKTTTTSTTTTGTTTTATTTQP